MVEIFFLGPEEVFDGDFFEFSAFMFAERHGSEFDRFLEDFENLFGRFEGFREVFKDFDVDDDIVHGAMSPFKGDVEVLTEVFERVDGTLSIETSQSQRIDIGMREDFGVDVVPLGFGGDEGHIEEDAVANEDIFIDHLQNMRENLFNFRFAVDHFGRNFVDLLGNFRNFAFGVDERFELLQDLFEREARNGDFYNPVCFWFKACRFAVETDKNFLF